MWGPRQGPSLRGVKCSSFLVTSCHRHLPALLTVLSLLLNPSLLSRLFVSILCPSHSLRCPCPASYYLVPGGSNACSQALGLVMLLPRCADMPEFALTFALSFQNEMFSLLIYSSGFRISNLAPVSYFYLCLILLLMMCYFQYLNSHHPPQLLTSQLFQSLSPEKPLLVLAVWLSLRALPWVIPKKYLAISKGYSSPNCIGAEFNLSAASSNCCSSLLGLLVREDISNLHWQRQNRCRPLSPR